MPVTLTRCTRARDVQRRRRGAQVSGNSAARTSWVLQASACCQVWQQQCRVQACCKAGHARMSRRLLHAGMRARAHRVCSASVAARAVSGESAAAPGAFLTGANSSSRRTSSSAQRSASGKLSKMNSSSLMPCARRSVVMCSNAPYVRHML